MYLIRLLLVMLFSSRKFISYMDCSYYAVFFGKFTLSACDSFPDVIAIQSSETTTSGIIQLNNENTTRIPETTLLNSTKIIANADDTVQNVNKSSAMITKDVNGENINRSSTDIPNKIDNVAISDKLIDDVVNVNEVHMRNPIELPSFEINANDSELIDNPDAIVITSTNYPNPYPDKYNETWR